MNPIEKRIASVLVAVILLAFGFYCGMAFERYRAVNATLIQSAH